MPAAKAYSPGHITGFFRIYSSGSTGAGINISDGVTTTVKATKSKSNKIEIFINRKKSKAQTSRTVTEYFLKKSKQKYHLKIYHKVPLPISYGLGLSGAGALSLTFALNKIFRTRYSKEQIRKLATKAEIVCGTGLGDVTAELYKGFIVGKKPYPSNAAQELKQNKKYVVMGFFRPIFTKRIIRSPSWKRKINKIGSECMRKFSRKKNLNSFFHWSRYFTASLGLSNRKILQLMDAEFYCSQAMLGQTIFALTNNPKKIKKLFRKYTKRVAVTRVAKKGAHVF